MKKRSIKLGDYDTAANGLWTLSALALKEPEAVTNIVEVPGRIRGPLDMSDILTDGEPSFTSRTLTITLESSEGSRMAREERIAKMTQLLHGRQFQILLPDDPLHYLIGRISVQKLYNDMAYCSVEVDAVCEPWKYNTEETVAELQATDTEKMAVLTNSGAMPVVPQIVVTGGSVNLTYASASWSLSAGTYNLLDLFLKTGEHAISYSGTGKMTISYREAVL